MNKPLAIPLPLRSRLRLVTALLLCIMHHGINAQEVQRAIMLGAGVGNTYDTYLSPLEYRGPQLTLLSESLRMTHWKNIATQGTFNLNALYIENRADNGYELSAALGYRQSWYYTWAPSSHWQFMAGGGAGGNLGFLYNIRNVGNNPAQAQLDVSVHAAAAARYSWRWLSLRAQFEAPLMGVMFAPNYEQSYYEIFGLAHADKNIVFTHPANCPTFRTMFTADIQFKRRALRLGYGADILQSTPNNMRRHTYLHTGYIGYVRRLKLL